MLGLSISMKEGMHLARTGKSPQTSRTVCFSTRLCMYTCALTTNIHEGRYTRHNRCHTGGSPQAVALLGGVWAHFLQQLCLLTVMGDVRQNTGANGIHFFKSDAVCHFQQPDMGLKGRRRVCCRVQQRASCTNVMHAASAMQSVLKALRYNSGQHLSLLCVDTALWIAAAAFHKQDTR